MPRLPDFLFIGAMKSGSSSFWEYLRRHPQVFMPPYPPEPGFFAKELRWELGLDWYRNLFADAGDALAVGEASTWYTRFPRHAGVPARIAQIVPDVRMIYLLRDPIERIRSHYIHNMAKGLERSPIERAVFEDPDYLDFSRYAMQLERYLEYFPLERILILFSGDLRSRRLKTLQTAFQFLGVTTNWTHPLLEKEFNTAVERRHVLAADRIVRRLPGYRYVTGLFPPTLRRRIHTRLFTRRVDLSGAVITESLHQRLGEELAEDVARLRRYLGSGFHGWGIA